MYTSIEEWFEEVLQVGLDNDTTVTASMEDLSEFYKMGMEPILAFSHWRNEDA